MFKFLLLSIFTLLLFTSKSYAVIDYSVLDSVTRETTYEPNLDWSYVDETNVLTVVFPTFSLLESTTYNFRLYVCPDKDTTSYTLSDCIIVDKNQMTGTDTNLTLTFSNSEIDEDNLSYLVLLYGFGEEFFTYGGTVIDTTKTPAEFSLPPDIAPEGTLDFDDDGNSDTIDANFLYTYLLSKQNDSLFTLLTSLVKGGEGTTEDIKAATVRVENQLEPLGNLDFDNDEKTDTIDANFLYTYILSRENDSLSTLLTSLVKGGEGTTEDINLAKTKIDALLTE